MKFRIKTAVIGVGNMGKNHLRVYSKLSNLIAIADVSALTGLPLSEKYGVRYYQNYQEMLDREKPQAVSVAVPTKFHTQVAIHCLQRRIPVLLEKPIAGTITEAQAVISEAQKNQVGLMIGQIERFNPAVVELKSLLIQNKLGKIISLLAIRVGINPPNFRQADVVVDLALHDVDVFNYLLDEYPVEKIIFKCKINKDNIADSASLLFRYRRAVGMIQTNWITPIKMRKLLITGTRGFAEMDYINQKLILYNKASSQKPVGDFTELVSLSRIPIKKIYISRKEPLWEEISFFLSSLSHRDKFRGITNDSLKALSSLL